MNDNVTQTSMFGTEKIYKILLRLAPPVMFAQLIQALYNIVDSYFVGKYSPDGLTALSVIFPVQLIITALAVGTGVGVNTQMARLFAQEKGKEADKTAGTGMVLSLLTWAVSAVLMLIGVFCFELLPGALLGLFSHDPDVFSIGIPAFRIIGLSFLPAVVSLLSPVFFQASGNARISALLSLIRQLGCLIPIFFALSKIGLSYTWIAFPASEIITGALGISLYLRQVRQWAGGVD